MLSTIMLQIHFVTFEDFFLTWSATLSPSQEFYYQVMFLINKYFIV